MRTTTRLALVGVCAGTLASVAWAQQRQGPRGGAPAGPSSQANASGTAAIVSRLMAFDANGDGKVTRAEITDSRLLRLFDRADTNHDGSVTRDEAEKLAAQMVAENPISAGGPGGFGGPGGPGGPGQILPPFLQERLNLTDEQKQKLTALQQEVDRKLQAILTDDQRRQLQEMGRGPGGPGGPGGQGGANSRRFGGPPPEGAAPM